MTPGSSDSRTTLKLTDISEPVSINSGDSLINPAVLLGEREPDESTDWAISLTQ